MKPINTGILLYTLCFYFISINLFSQNIRITQPNIIFILVDDLGYSDVGYMNQKPNISTPNIDKLAKAGMVFTNAYAASPVCSPTRASILTGKYPSSLKLTCHIPGIGMDKYITKQNEGKKLMEAEFIDHLPLNEITFAEILKKNGYKTAFMGKWHLAGGGSQFTKDGIVDESYHPNHQGFDVNIGGNAYGQPANYFSPYHNATISDGPPNEYLTDRLSKEACSFIETNKKEKILLYLSFYSVHTPHQAPKSLIKKYNGDKHLAMIEKVDHNIGKIMKTLDKLGLTENTLIVFYSDNGGTGNNPPLRNTKGSLFEGGIRVPLIFSLPGIIPEKSISDVPVISPDFFPTIMDAVDISSMTYNVNQLEGISLWPMLNKGKDLNKRSIYWHFPHHRTNEKSMASAVREGNWKLIWEYETDRLSLFNLKNDIAETTNLIDEFPAKAEELQQKLTRWLKQTNASMPKPNPNFK